MAVQRDFPYIWATWLPKLLTGENSCEWAVWFKAHYQGWDRPPSDFNQSEWMVPHTALLNKVRDDWQERGYRVYAEDQNTFRLRGNLATLAGKPDLIAQKDQKVVIIDGKTGRAGPSHAIQVMIYQYSVPLALNHYRGRTVTGLVAYQDHAVDVPALANDDPFVGKLIALIRRVAAAKPAILVPSRAECRFCDITNADCPDRVDQASETGEGTTADF